MIYIVSGDIETGKSSSLLKWIKGRTDVFGILSPIDKKNKRYILDIHTKARVKMEASHEDKDTIAVGRYHFYNSAFKSANSIIQNAANEQNYGFIIIDELGKLELQSKGLHKSAQLAIEKTIHHQTLHSILVIRTSLLSAIKKQFKISQSRVFNQNTLPVITI